VGTNQEFKDLLSQWLPRSPQKVRTIADLVEAARVPPSSVSMVISGKRSLRSDVAERLAAALCEDDSERKRLVKKLVEQGQKAPRSDEEPKPRQRDRRKESVVERVRMGHRIKVGLIVSEPFVKADEEAGFAVDLFRHLASLMRIKYKPDTLQLKDLERRLASGEFDIIVTALLPTFRRHTFMRFSRPFPYLGIPLSGLVSCTFEEKLKAAGMEFHAQHLLNHPSKELLIQVSGAKLMLVRGEAGEEFAEAFFSSKLMGQFKLVESPEDLAPANLLEAMVAESADLFVADVGTCRSVMEQREASKSYTPLKESEQTEIMSPLQMGAQKYAKLALYRIAFGLPKGDDQWKRMIDDAFEYLMSEGIRSLLSLYRDYLDLDKQGDSFKPFLLPTDDSVQSHVARSYFEKLPEIRELIDKAKVEDEH